MITFEALKLNRKSSRLFDNISSEPQTLLTPQPSSSKLIRKLSSQTNLPRQLQKIPEEHSSNKSKSRQAEQVDYQHLSNLMFQKSHPNFKHPSNLRLISLLGFRRSKQILEKHVLQGVYMRAKYMLEIDLFQKIRQKAEERMKLIESGGEETPLLSLKKSKSKKLTPIQLKRSKSKGPLVNTKFVLNPAQLSDKSSLESQIYEISQHNKLIRTLVNIVGDKSRSFFIDFSDDLLSYLVLSFFEFYNLSQIPTAFFLSLESQSKS